MSVTGSILPPNRLHQPTRFINLLIVLGLEYARQINEREAGRAAEKAREPQRRRPGLGTESGSEGGCRQGK